MKQLNTYILEKLHLDKNIKVNSYNYHPEDKVELIELIKNRLEETEEYDKLDLNDIDTSKIVDMAYIFQMVKEDYPKLRNFDISKWDVSRVERMDGMFRRCEDFNCDLSKWDVSNVTRMDEMFAFCHAFKGKGLDKWKTDSLESTHNMFNSCRNFNQDISSWNMSKVTDIGSMFSMCIRYEGIDIGKWDVSNVKNFDSVFYGCKKFNSDISKWNVSKGNCFLATFAGCEKFEYDLEDWNVKVDAQKMKWMFNNCPKLKNKPSWYKK